MKRILDHILKILGFELVKIQRLNDYKFIYSKHSKIKNNIVNIETLAGLSLNIPGMITPESGKFLFSLCYMQEISGDVVEIGSWQGRSTTFLARAVEESKNGDFYAIDHFAGNKGKENFYQVNGSLDYLKDNFLMNMQQFKLEKTVKLLDMVNTKAAEHMDGKTVRFLFIDGDHTKSGVQKDIELFFPLLTKGSIVVFDDYFEGFPGLIEAVDDMLLDYNFTRIFTYKNTLVLKI
jgi:hypothetical protein